MLHWGVASIEETAPRRNNLPLLFLHLGVAPTGGVGGAGGPVVLPISGSGEIIVWWSSFGTLAGGGRVGCYSYVWCHAVECVNVGTR